MPDLHHDSELTGNGAGRVSEQQSPHSNDDSPAQKDDRRPSDSDTPKKKRKVNHGETAFSSLNLFLN